MYVLLFRPVLVWMLVACLSSHCYGADHRRGGKESPPHALYGLPSYYNAAHDVGRVRLSVSNYGSIGGSWGAVDFFRGEVIRYNCEYPKKAGIEHLSSAGLWVRAIRLRDTLVSTCVAGGSDGAAELNPDMPPFGEFTGRSIADPDDPETAVAISEQDILCTYTDTMIDPISYGRYDYIEHRPHQPLFLRVEQSSYAWSYGYAEDIVLFNFRLTNIGDEPWKDMYLGLYVDSDIGLNWGGSDDLVGFRHTAPAQFGCGFVDTVNIACTADNDGEPIGGVWVEPPRCTINIYSLDGDHIITLEHDAPDDPGLGAESYVKGN